MPKATAECAARHGHPPAPAGPARAIVRTALSHFMFPDAEVAAVRRQMCAAAGLPAR